MKRIVQFLNDVLSNFKNVDESYINKFLNKEEKHIFLTLRKAEVIHSIIVAKKTEELLKNKEESNNLGFTLSDYEKKHFIKASLVHDIGKVMMPLGPIKKTAAVLLSKVIPKKERYDKKGIIDGILNVYYNHPEFGANILRKLKSFDEYPWLYDLVALHDEHTDFIKDRSKKEIVLFNIYKEADDNS